MISSVQNFSVRILDADRFKIVIFQLLDIKSNYLPSIVHMILPNFRFWVITVISHETLSGVSNSDYYNRVVGAKFM
jgi:hypothetical protein